MANKNKSIINIISADRDYVFVIPEGRKEALLKIKKLLQNPSPVVVLQASDKDYIFPKDWLCNNAVISVEEKQDDDFDNDDIISKATKLLSDNEIDNEDV